MASLLPNWCDLLSVLSEILWWRLGRQRETAPPQHRGTLKGATARSEGGGGGHPTHLFAHQLKSKKKEAPTFAPAVSISFFLHPRAGGVPIGWAAEGRSRQPANERSPQPGTAAG